MKIPVWTFSDMSVDDVAKFANDNKLQPGDFQVLPLNPLEDDYVRVVYLAAAI